MTLAAYLTDGGTGRWVDELRAWLAESRRFAVFAEAHRDKIRRKLRSAADADARLDVRAELRVASLLLSDRRIDIAFEPAGSARGGPDFAVAFRTHPAFNLEVTRPRAAAVGETVRRVILAKLRQLPAGAANVLLIAVDGDPPPEPVLAAAAHDLRTLVADADPRLLARAGVETPRQFQRQFQRLGAIVAWSERATTPWRNPSSRITVPDAALRACLSALAPQRRPASG